MKLSSLGEFGLISRIENITGKPSKNVIKGIGDDTAVIKRRNGPYLLYTIDTLVEGVHFDLKYFKFSDLGWKALAVNLSDIASMGGVPQYAVVSLGITRKTGTKDVLDIYKGMKLLAKKFNVDIVGGDTVLSPDRITITVALIGEVKPKNLLLRKGAKVGDLIMTTGTFGGASLGLRSFRTLAPRPQTLASRNKHLRPLPRGKEGSILSATHKVSAMMDDSDGLAFTVGEICRQSGTGAKLYTGLIPKASGASLKEALYGGEDFELVFTCKRAYTHEVAYNIKIRTGTKVSIIGEIVSAKYGILIIDKSGKTSRLRLKGYDHFK